MTKRFVFLLLTLGYFPLFAAQNYADEILATLEQKVATLSEESDPVEKLLVGEQLYYLGHETSRQHHLASLISKLRESSDHQELRVDLSFFLTQLYRQLGEYDKVEALIKDQGYVNDWRVLGPLPPNQAFSLKKMVTGDQHKGANRPIRWQHIKAYGDNDHYWDQGLGHFGFFSSNHAIYPNQLAGALFTTWFYLPKKDVYRFGLGWTNQAKAWINQTRIFEGSEDHEPRPDQDIVYFKMRKGWHRLTIYIESQSERPNLGLFARITDSNGTPVIYNANHKSRISNKKPELGIRGEASLADLAKASSPLQLGYLLMAKERFNSEQYGNPKELIASAFSENPTRILTERMLNQTQDPNDRWQYLNTFLKKAGETPENALDRAWALTQLGQIALSQERFWEGRHYADRAIAEFPGYWPATILKNNIFATLGLDGEALRYTKQLNEKYPNIPWIMMDLADLYWSMNFLSETEKLTDQVLAIRRSNGKFGERKIKILKDRGDLAALDRFYQEMLKDAPYSVPMIRSYTQFLIGNKKLREAEALLARSLAQIPENPFLLEAMGELKMTMEHPDALVYLEKALTLRPQNPALEKLIDLTKAEEFAFYQPYRIEAPPDVPVLEKSPIVINFTNTVTKVAPNGQSSTYHQVEYEIINEQGTQELNGHSFSYAPLRQNAEVIKSEIARGEQTILLTQFSRSRISDPAYRMYYDLVAYQIPFPTLEVGDRIRVEYRIDDVHQTNIFGNYFGDLRYFADSHPTKRMAYTLIFPKNRKLHYHVEKMDPVFKVTEMGDDLVYSWVQDQVSPYETEARMPGLAGYLPYVGVSTFDDWQEMASWYADLIKDQLVLNSETKAIVKDLTANLSDPLEIVKKIHEYVITNTRYVALEFGIHGYKPYQVNQVCTRQFGDCKDKASLIVAMLREAGVEASIVIVRTSDEGEVHPFPAMLSYFNHAIAYVPQFDLYLDGTAEFSGINELPEMDQGALVLIVDNEGRGNLTQIPVKGDNSQNMNLELEVLSDGLADVRGQLSYTGVRTPRVRQYLSIDTKLSQNLQDLLAETVPGLNVLEADRKGMEINEPITLNFKGQTRQLLQVSEGQIKLPLNILGVSLTQAYAPNAKRRFPLEIGVPTTKSIQMKIDAPSGYKLGKVPPHLDVGDDNFSVRIHFDQRTPEQCIVDYQVAFKSTRINPADYSSLRTMMQAHDQVLDQAIHFVVQ